MQKHEIVAWIASVLTDPKISLPDAIKSVSFDCDHKSGEIIIDLHDGRYFVISSRQLREGSNEDGLSKDSIDYGFK